MNIVNIVKFLIEKDSIYCWKALRLEPAITASQNGMPILQNSNEHVLKRDEIKTERPKQSEWWAFKFQKRGKIKW